MGLTPKDVLKAGTDRNGRPIYIGQALYENALVPGSIHENQKQVEIEYNKAYIINEAVKVIIELSYCYKDCIMFATFFRYYALHILKDSNGIKLVTMKSLK